MMAAKDMRRSRPNLARGQPALKVHWLKPGKKKKPACGQVITSWSTSNPNVVTCQKCKGIIVAATHR